ncbi:hypothetical protein F4859DRAFT_325645 [Xylaria cf. heliscus]|nr:hypothetical protein F4859DRAFT_325645 [Xylaria cf. heliscus]
MNSGMPPAVAQNPNGNVNGNVNGNMNGNANGNMNGNGNVNANANANRNRKMIQPPQDSILSLSFRLLVAIFQQSFGFLSGIFFLFSTVGLLVVIVFSFFLGSAVQISNTGLLGDYRPPPVLQYEMVFPNADVLAYKQVNKEKMTEFRLLVNGDTSRRAVKYASVSFDVRSLGVRKDDYSSISVIQMPVFPDGDYCSVHVGLSPDGKQASFTTTSCQPHASVQGAWHDDNFDFLEMKTLDWARTTERVKLIRHPALDTPGSLAVMKFAPFASTVANISREIQMYQHLQGLDLAPEFLGQVVEHGRTIGFLIEYIESARPVSSKSDFSDLALDRCKDALAKLHAAGVAHNDAHPRNCLIRKNGHAFLIDFEHATLASNSDPFTFEDDCERDIEFLVDNY